LAGVPVTFKAPSVDARAVRDDAHPVAAVGIREGGNRAGQLQRSAMATVAVTLNPIVEA